MALIIPQDIADVALLLTQGAEDADVRAEMARSEITRLREATKGMEDALCSASTEAAVLREAAALLAGDAIKE